MKESKKIKNEITQTEKSLDKMKKDLQDALKNENKSKLDEIVSYLDKVSQHLFIDEDGYMMKVIPIKTVYGSSLWRTEYAHSYMCIKFKEGKANAWIREIKPSELTNDSLGLLKQRLFPNYERHGGKYKAIRSWKAINEKFDKVKNLVHENYSSNSDAQKVLCKWVSNIMIDNA